MPKGKVSDDEKKASIPVGKPGGVITLADFYGFDSDGEEGDFDYEGDCEQEGDSDQEGEEQEPFFENQFNLNSDDDESETEDEASITSPDVEEKDKAIKVARPKPDKAFYSLPEGIKTVEEGFEKELYKELLLFLRSLEKRSSSELRLHVESLNSKVVALESARKVPSFQKEYADLKNFLKTQINKYKDPFLVPATKPRAVLPTVTIATIVEHKAAIKVNVLAATPGHIVVKDKMQEKTAAQSDDLDAKYKRAKELVDTDLDEALHLCTELNGKHPRASTLFQLITFKMSQSLQLSP